MASRGNPNVPRKAKKVSNRAKVLRRKAGQVSKNPRGKNSSTVLYPTAGPQAPLSAKKARKVEKAHNHARQRAIEKAMAEAGEIQMTDAPTMTKSNIITTEAAVSNAEKMEVDV